MFEHARCSIEFNPDVCKGCGICVEACPPKGVRLSAKLNCQGVYPAQHIDELCQGCGTCYYFCPELGAIRLHPRKAPGRAVCIEPAA